LKGTYNQEGEQFFTWSNSDKTRGNGFKLKVGRFRLGIRWRFFCEIVVRHWHKLRREAVVLHPWRPQGQVGRGPVQSELVGGSPAHGRE